MKLWVDDIRPAPEGYIWVKSVNKAKAIILDYFKFIDRQTLSIYKTQEVIDYVWKMTKPIFMDDDVIDIDHDAGEYVKDGGDYIKLLDWLEEKDYDFPIHIHSQNPVGVKNMRRIIKRNGWKEV